jgi:hypothetical protein
MGILIFKVRVSWRDPILTRMRVKPRGSQLGEGKRGGRRCPSDDGFVRRALLFDVLAYHGDWRSRTATGE